MGKWIKERDAADIVLAQECLETVFIRGGQRINELVSELWTWETLPAKFDISSEGWIKAEAELTAAAQVGYWWRVVDLGDQYIARIDTFCHLWRAKARRNAA